MQIVWERGCRRKDALEYVRDLISFGIKRKELHMVPVDGYLYMVRKVKKDIYAVYIGPRCVSGDDPEGLKELFGEPS